MGKAKYKNPKSVAGVRVPKALRKSGLAKAFLNHPLGRSILADALVAAAGAAAASLGRHRSAHVSNAAEATVDAAKGAAATTTDAVKSAVGTLGHIVAEVAQEVMPEQKDEPKAEEKRKRNADWKAEADRRH